MHWKVLFSVYIGLSFGMLCNQSQLFNVSMIDFFTVKLEFPWWWWIYRQTLEGWDVTQAMATIPWDALVKARLEYTEHTIDLRF